MCNSVSHAKLTPKNLYFFLKHGRIVYFVAVSHRRDKMLLVCDLYFKGLLVFPLRAPRQAKPLTTGSCRALACKRSPPQVDGPLATLSQQQPARKRVSRAVANCAHTRTFTLIRDAQIFILLPTVEARQRRGAPTSAQSAVCVERRVSLACQSNPGVRSHSHAHFSAHLFAHLAASVSVVPALHYLN